MISKVLFKRLAVLATLATYFLIFLGGLVRVSGAGLGCPDWPRCFGRWIPPVNVGQLPADLDPSLFNFTLAWIEYINRLVGVGVGLLIALVAVVAIVRFRKEPRLLWPPVLAALLTAFQGWQGSRVVASELAPLLVSVHMVLALVIVSLLIYTGFQAHRLANETSEKAPTGRRRGWLLGLWVLLLVQIVLGTQFREALEHAATVHPLLFDSDLVATLGAIKLIHPLFGILVALVIWIVALGVRRRRRETSPLLLQSVFTLGGLGLIQLALGVAMTWLGLRPVLQSLHMWISAIMAGIALIAWLAARERAVAQHEGTGGAGRLLVLVVAAAVVLGLLASIVAGRARSSRANLPVLGQVPAFEFTAHWGEPFGRDDMLGRLSVVYFGFTSCRGPCPVMAANLIQLYHDYEGSELVQFVKISVDPERDSLAALVEYARGLGVHDRRWAFLRAPLRYVVWLCEEGFMMAADNLPMGHSTKFVLVDHEGRIRSYHDGMDHAAVHQLRQNIRALAEALP